MDQKGEKPQLRLPSQFPSKKVPKPKVPSGRTATEIAEECIAEIVKREKTSQQKRELLEATWTELCENGHDTFYIESKLSKKAIELRSIAKSLIKDKDEAKKSLIKDEGEAKSLIKNEGKGKGYFSPEEFNDYENGCTYQLLMPTVENNRSKTTLEDLPADSNQLILSEPSSDSDRFLVLISEIEKTTQSHTNGARAGVLLNPCTNKPVSDFELSQLKKKAKNLYDQEQTKRTTSEAKAYLSPLTLRVLTFVLNITLSNASSSSALTRRTRNKPTSSNIGETTLETRFYKALRENPHFNHFYETEFKPKEHELFVMDQKNDPGFGPERTPKLACAFKYLESYLRTLPADEFEAFEQLNNSTGHNLYQKVLAQHTNDCLSTASQELASFVYMAHTENTTLSHNFKNNADILGWGELGSLARYVKNPNVNYSATCKAFDPIPHNQAQALKELESKKTVSTTTSASTQAPITVPSKTSQRRQKRREEGELFDNISSSTGTQTNPPPSSPNETNALEKSPSKVTTVEPTIKKQARWKDYLLGVMTFLCLPASFSGYFSIYFTRNRGWKAKTTLTILNTAAWVALTFFFLSPFGAAFTIPGLITLPVLETIIAGTGLLYGLAASLLMDKPVPANITQVKTLEPPKAVVEPIAGAPKIEHNHQMKPDTKATPDLDTEFAKEMGHAATELEQTEARAKNTFQRHPVHTSSKRSSSYKEMGSQMKNTSKKIDQHQGSVDDLEARKEAPKKSNSWFASWFNSSVSKRQVPTSGNVVSSASRPTKVVTSTGFRE